MRKRKNPVTVNHQPSFVWMSKPIRTTKKTTDQEPYKKAMIDTKKNEVFGCMPKGLKKGSAPCRWNRKTKRPKKKTAWIESYKKNPWGRFESDTMTDDLYDDYQCYKHFQHYKNFRHYKPVVALYFATTAFKCFSFRKPNTFALPSTLLLPQLFNRSPYNNYSTDPLTNNNKFKKKPQCR